MIRVNAILKCQKYFIGRGNSRSSPVQPRHLHRVPHVIKQQWPAPEIPRDTSLSPQSVYRNRITHYPPVNPDVSVIGPFGLLDLKTRAPIPTILPKHIRVWLELKRE